MDGGNTSTCHVEISGTMTVHGNATCHGTVNGIDLKDLYQRVVGIERYLKAKELKKVGLSKELIKMVQDYDEQSH